METMLAKALWAEKYLYFLESIFHPVEICDVVLPKASSLPHWGPKTVSPGELFIVNLQVRGKQTDNNNKTYYLVKGVV